MAQAKPKRTVALIVRVTPEEKESFRERAANDGVSVSDFLRRRIQLPALRKRRVRSLNTQALADALGQLGKVGGNLNQIAHALNIIKMKSGDPQALATLQGLEHQLSLLVADQKEVKHLIRQALLNHDPEE